MMSDKAFVGAVVVLLLVAIAIAAAVSRPRHESKGARPRAEHYGPPPGMRRALDPLELPDRGYVEFPREYEANTASSISALIERSA